MTRVVYCKRCSFSATWSSRRFSDIWATASHEKQLWPLESRFGVRRHCWVRSWTISGGSLHFVHSLALAKHPTQPLRQQSSPIFLCTIWDRRCSQSFTSLSLLDQAWGEIKLFHLCWKFCWRFSEFQLHCWIWNSQSTWFMALGVACHSSPCCCRCCASLFHWRAGTRSERRLSSHGNHFLHWGCEGCLQKQIIHAVNGWIHLRRFCRWSSRLVRTEVHAPWTQNATRQREHPT